MNGYDSEHEYIEVVEMPIAEALDALDNGHLADAKTIIALQWYCATVGVARPSER